METRYRRRRVINAQMKTNSLTTLWVLLFTETGFFLKWYIAELTTMREILAQWPHLGSELSPLWKG